MKKKAAKPLRMMPLVECEVIPITDPAEIAALEKRIRKAEKMLAAQANGKKAGRKRK